MLSIFKTEKEIAKDIVNRIKLIRKQQKISQKELANKSGVSFGSVKRFETTGDISLNSLLKIAFALGYQKDFDKLFSLDIDISKFKNLDEMLKASKELI